MLRSYAPPSVAMLAVIGLFFLAGPHLGSARGLLLWAAPILYVMACVWFSCVAAFDPRPWIWRLFLIWAPLIAPAGWVTWMLLNPDSNDESQAMALTFSTMVALPIAIVSSLATLLLLIYFALRRFEPSKAEPG
jgi:hypothetical protein